MIKVCFVSANGEDLREVSVQVGTRLLEAAQADGQPLEGTCEGQMACSTCHVIVERDWFTKLPKASEDEEDMLDLAVGATRHSRLACQIELTQALDGLTVRIPAKSRNMQGR